MLTPQERTERANRLAALAGQLLLWSARLADSNLAVVTVALQLTTINNKVTAEIRSFAEDVRDA